MTSDSLEKQTDKTIVGSSGDAQFKQLVEVISRSQNNYRELIDSLDHAVFTLSLEGEIRVANRRLAEILGVSFQELIGHRFSEFVEAPTPAEAARALPDLFESGSWFGTVPARLKNAPDPRFFDCWLQTVAENGQVAYISGWARDVTEQRESETRFKDLFESIREGIFFTSADGRILDANPALVRMLGFASKEELQSRNFGSLYVDSSVRDLLIQEVREKGVIHDREIVLSRKDGRPIHCLDSCFAIRDAAGKILRFQGTLVDVTERREIEKRLHQEQEFVRRLIVCFPDAIAVLDRQGHFTYMSQRIQDVLGEPPQEFVGKALGARAHPEDQAKVAEMFRSLMEGHAGQVQFEFRTLHADGTWRILRASAAPLFDAGGKINGVVASARDITQSKQSEEQLAQNEKFSAMGHMMAGAAHELNNPLTAILGVSDLLRERSTDDATRRQAEIVLQQARRAANIVQNLLDFSRPSSMGRAKLQLKEIIPQALRLQQDSLRQKNITVQFDAPGDVPVIEGDSRLLTQVFSNLITNAEQAISSAREHGTLKITLAQEDGKICIAFSDDGAGIAPEYTRRIFDPFFTTKRPGGGSGLGLTICLAIIKEHGGSIEVESSPGAGAIFRILLPVPAAQLHEDARPATPARTAPAELSALLGHSVLVVDDEDSIREIVQEGLSARGMKVEGAASSEEALSHLAEKSYDIVLCDFNLPGLKGEQLFDQLRAQANISMPRFVFMTGDLLDPAIITTFSEKGAYVMQKPFHIAALATLLVEFLQPQPASS